MKLPVSVVRSFDDIQRNFEWLSTVMPEFGLEIERAESDNGADLALPNTGAQVNAPGCALTVAAEKAAETWLIGAQATVRADSANDTGVRARVTANTSAAVGDLTAELASGHAERLYWGTTAATQQWSTITMLGATVLTPGVSQTLTLQVQIANGSAFGGFLNRFPLNTRLLALRVL